VSGYQLVCTIDRRGHDPIIPRGHAVKCVYDHVEVNMFTRFVDDTRQLRDDEKLMMKEAGVGLVIDHTWHADPLALLGRARIDPRITVARHVPHLCDVTEDLWYYVAFTKGIFLARFDHIETVTEPV
jgi:hypothetical protein